MKITEAIILAGGLGTRLRSAVPDLPKCMAPIDDKPFIAFVIAYLQKEGINRFIFSLGYKHEVIIDYLDKTHPALNKTYAIEDEPLGTGGAIALAIKQSETKNVLIVNGDTLFNINVDELAELHFSFSADCSIALKEMKEFSRYGTVETDKNERIKIFREKQYCSKGLINGGIYILNKQTFSGLAFPDVFSFEKDFLEKYLLTLRFYGLQQDYYFIDIGIPEDYNSFAKDYKFIMAKNKYEENKQGSTLFEIFLESIWEIIN